MALGVAAAPEAFQKKNREILCAKLNLFRLTCEGAKRGRRLLLAPLPKFRCSTRQFHRRSHNSAKASPPASLRLTPLSTQPINVVCKSNSSLSLSLHTPEEGSRRLITRASVYTPLISRARSGSKIRPRSACVAHSLWPLCHRDRRRTHPHLCRNIWACDVCLPPPAQMANCD